MQQKAMAPWFPGTLLRDRPPPRLAVLILALEVPDRLAGLGGAGNRRGYLCGCLSQWATGPTSLERRSWVGLGIRPEAKNDRELHSYLA